MQSLSSLVESAPMSTKTRFQHRLAQDYTVQVSYGPIVVRAGTVLLEGGEETQGEYLYKTTLYVVVIPAEYVETVLVGT